MDAIKLGHGSGGRLTHELIDTLFVKAFDNPALRKQQDSAIIKVGSKKIAFTADSYVVKPLFFPGGDIGSLAVHGTVNDLAVSGARPLALSCAIIMEEGLERRVLDRVVRSMAAAGRFAGVPIVTGDTKVVERGSCDRLFITTSGIGEVYYDGGGLTAVRPGDAVIVSGTIGDHAIAVLSEREGLELDAGVKSDSAPVHGLIEKMTCASKRVRIMRDPTRGGLGTTLCEFVRPGRFGIALAEESIPVSCGTAAACELLGYDPLYLACEGRVVAVVDARDARAVIKAMRAHPLGRRAAVIGTVVGEHTGKVYLETRSGGRRLVDMLAGEQLPRIC